MKKPTIDQIAASFLMGFFLLGSVYVIANLIIEYIDMKPEKTEFKYPNADQ